MYAVPFDTFMNMTSVRPHQHLLEDGELVAFTPDMGKVLFVSHQWVDDTFPDPEFKQLSVLQEALQNILRERALISVHLNSQLLFGARKTIAAADLNAQPLFVWYDFFCCPQPQFALPGQDAVGDLGKAVASIMGYVESSHFFVILAPPVRHAQHGHMLGYSTWKRRGWCRAERAARALSVGDHQNSMLLVQSPAQLQVATPSEVFHGSVGRGEFTKDSDRATLAPVMKALVRNRLEACLETGDLHEYRLLLNGQAVLFEELDVAAIAGLVPEEACARPEARPLSPLAEEGVPRDAERATVTAAVAHASHGGLGPKPSDSAARFMCQNGFATVADRDEGGWSPLCLAALSGNPLLLRGLLDLKGDVDDQITKNEPRLRLMEGDSLLHISAQFGNNESLRLLIARKAQVNARNRFGMSALKRAAIRDNTEGIRILWRSRCDLNLTDKLGSTALAPSCAWGSANAVKALIEAGLPAMGAASGLSGLHLCALFEGTPEVASCLIQANWECVNSPARPQVSNPLGVLFTLRGLKYRFSADMISRLGYHFFDATPLMISVLTGKLDIVDVLVDAKADLTLRNSRGKTAQDLAIESSLPAFVMDRLKPKIKATL